MIRKFAATRIFTAKAQVGRRKQVGYNSTNKISERPISADHFYENNGKKY
jgi:hypothetical protein